MSISFVWSVTLKKDISFSIWKISTQVYIWFLLEVLQNNDDFFFFGSILLSVKKQNKTKLLPRGQILLFRSGVAQGHKLRREHGGLTGILR